MSFASSSGGVPIERVLGSPEQKWASQQLEAKMDVVNSLLSMLGSQEHVDMGETLLALSTCPESCLAMRQSGKFFVLINKLSFEIKKIPLLVSRILKPICRILKIIFVLVFGKEFTNLEQGQIQK